MQTHTQKRMNKYEHVLKSTHTVQTSMNKYEIACTSTKCYERYKNAHTYISGAIFFGGLIFRFQSF